MAEKRPLVLYAGSLEELAAADTLPGGGVDWALYSSTIVTAPVATGTDSLAMGDGASTGNTNSSVAIGDGAGVTGATGLALGFGAKAGNAGVSVGRGCTGTAQTQILVGYNQAGGSTNSLVGVGLNNTLGLNFQNAFGQNILASSVDSDDLYTTKIGYGSAGVNLNLMHLMPKGKLELYGSEAQFVAPGHTTVGIGTLTGVEGGLIIDSDTKELNYYNGTSWAAIGGGGLADGYMRVDNGTSIATAPLGSGSNSIAFGNDTDSGTLNNSFAIGNNVTNSSATQVSVGYNITNGATTSVCVGDNLTGAGVGVLIGSNISNVWQSGQSVLIGRALQATNVAASSVIIGQSNSASQRRAVCIGYDVDSTVADQVVIGTLTDGLDVTTDVPYSVKIGHGNPLNASDTNMLHLFTKGRLELYGDEAQFLLPGYTTAGLPAVTAGQYGIMFDTTLGEPVWSNGTTYSTFGGGGGGLADGWLHCDNGTAFTTDPVGTGSNGISLGNSANSSSQADNIAIGTGALVNGAYGYNVVIGRSARSTAWNGVVLGDQAKVDGSYGVSVGYLCDAGGSSIAIGNNADGLGIDNIAIGHGVGTASAKQNQIVMGESSILTLDGQVSLGAGITSVDVTTDVAYSVKLGYAFTSTADKNLLHLFSKGKLELYGDEAQFVLPEYTVATVPTGVSGGMIAVTDETGGYVPAFYDGTNWRRVTDRTIVA